MLNKKRTHDKWILPKNNNSLERHRAYIIFVLNFFKKNNKYPSINEYCEGIMHFLNEIEMNDKTKKTNVRHQLFQPVFFNMLFINEEECVVPSKWGLAFAADCENEFLSEIIYFLFSSAIFSTGATGTSTLYDSVQPIKSLITILIDRGYLTPDELSGKFYSRTTLFDFDKTPFNFTKKPSWEYILRMMEKSNLILRKDKMIGDAIHNKTVFPTNKLINLVANESQASDKALNNLSLGFLKEENLIATQNMEKSKKQVSMIRRNIKDVVAKQQTIVLKNLRSPVWQKFYRSNLLNKYNECQLCGIKNRTILRASHIKPFSKSSKDEAFDPENGMLLCALHDVLFDKGLITFIDGKIKYSKQLESHDLKKIKSGISSNPQKIIYSIKYMNYHNNCIFKDEEC